MTTNLDEIVTAIRRERAYQDRKYGPPAQRGLSVGAYLIIMHHEIEEAMRALVTQGADEAMIELLQAVAVGVAAMQQHDVIERPDVEAKVFL